MLTRKQFAKMYNKLRPGLGDEESVLWSPEEDSPRKSKWFVCIEPLQTTFGSSAPQHPNKEVFWAWVNANCTGKVRCYSSDYDNKQEWWGFENKSDIAWWSLKWS